MEYDKAHLIIEDAWKQMISPSFTPMTFPGSIESVGHMAGKKTGFGVKAVITLDTNGSFRISPTNVRAQAACNENDFRHSKNTAGPFDSVQHMHALRKAHRQLSHRQPRCITVERVTTELSALKLLEEEHVKRKCPGADGKAPAVRKAIGGGMESILPNVDAINLLGKGMRAARRPPVAVAAALVVVSIGLLIHCIVAPLLHETRRMEEIERQIAVRKEGVHKVERLKKEIDGVAKDVGIIEDFKEKRPMLLAILKEITAILPKNAWLTRARVTDTAVELEGYAASAPALLPILEQSKYLKKVEFAMPTTRDQRLKADRFLLKMELEGFDAMRPTGGGSSDEKKK